MSENSEKPKTTRKKKECTTCKKKPEITELPTLEIEPLVSEEEVKLLYTEMTNRIYSDEMYQRLNVIYSMLFQEKLDRCASCSRRQYRRVAHYVKHVLGKDWR